MKKTKKIFAMIVVFTMILGIIPMSVGITEVKAETFSDAKTISVNTSVSGNTGNGFWYEQDYYKFEVSSVGYVTVNFKNSLQADSETYWKVYLYNSSYEEIAYAEITGNKTSTNLATIGVTKGRYYIKVQSAAGSDSYSNFSNSTYKIKANFKSSSVWEKEFNDTYTTATSIKLNKTYYGTTRNGSWYEQDYYKFEVSSAGYVTVNFKNSLQASSDEYWKVYLYDSEYEEIAYAEINGNKTSTSLTTIGVAKGAYYIKIQSAAGSDSYSNFSNSTYKIKVKFTSSGVWEKEFNDTYTTATSIKLNKTYYGTTRNGSWYEQDYFKFKVSQKKNYVIGLTTPNLKDSDTYWQMYLYDSSYNEIAKIDINGNRTYHAIKAKLKKGTYYVKVQSSAGSDSYSNFSNKKYKLKVSSYSSLTPKKTSIKSSITAKTKGFTVKWKKISGGITGYQVQYSTSKSFKSKTTKTVSKSKGSLTVKKLKASKKYYVRVRTYKTYNINGENVKIYSKWSSVKSVKTKK